MSSPNFLAELATLRKKFPFQASVGFDNENSEYGDNIFSCANNYYLFECFDVSDSLYCEDHGAKIIGDVDCRFGVNSNSNCECLDYIDSSNCYFSQSFARCYNLFYCWYLVDCHDCFGCANLSNKSYCVFNVQYTKNEYEKNLPELKKMPKEEVLAKRLAIISKLPQEHSEHIDCTNSDYCDYAYILTNCYYCFDCARDQDCGYLTASYDCSNSWDCDHAVRNQQMLECSYLEDSYNCYEAHDCSRCFDSFYIENCSDCHDCFGCFNLSHQQFCILNVRYTEEEYKKKIAELRNELGLHFITSKIWA